MLFKQTVPGQVIKQATQHQEMDKSSQEDHLEIKMDGISISNNGEASDIKHHSHEDI